jgi:hypothetical protein
LSGWLRKRRPLTVLDCSKPEIMSVSYSTPNTELTKSHLLASVVLLLCGVWIAACDVGSPTKLPPSPTSPAAPSPTTHGMPAPVMLPEFTHANAIAISDSWAGFGYIDVASASYELERKEGVFTGLATFTVQGDSTRLGVHKVVTDVTVPADVADQFLSVIAESRAEEGEYDFDKISGCCDNVPALSITLRTGTAEIEFFSWSHQVNGQRWGSIFKGGNRVPWGVDFDGSTYVVNSGKPAEAYALLDPYLKKNMLADLIDQVGENPEGVLPQRLAYVR